LLLGECSACFIDFLASVLQAIEVDVVHLPLVGLGLDEARVLERNDVDDLARDGEGVVVHHRAQIRMK
jgi:hypothetical protein